MSKQTEEHDNHGPPTTGQDPNDLFEQLFSGSQNGFQNREQSNGQSNGQSASQGAQRSRPATQNQRASGGGADASGQRGSRDERDASGFISASMRAVRKITGWMPVQTPGAGGSSEAERTSAHTGKTTRVSTPEQLQDLEQRMKLSLRETSLSNIARIAVGSPKGGVGKSSTAYGLACSISYYTNMRVALVDADPNFGSTRLLVPRPIDASVVDLARDADELGGLSQLRNYIAQNEKMRLDVVLGPAHAYELAEFDDLGAAYERIDEVLSRHYDVIVYDLGLGFRDPAIRRVLALCNELLFVTDSEVIPNAMLDDGIAYIQHLGVDLERTTLVINHRLPKQHESADTSRVRQAAEGVFRHVTDIPYDEGMSQLLNRRAFHIESLTPDTRRGILTTLAACLEGLMHSTRTGARVSDRANKVA